MTRSLSALDRLRLTVTSAAVAAINPARADMVALVGDLTSEPVLSRLAARIRATPEGSDMLTSLRPARFPANGSADLPALRSLPERSLGREYARFMDERNFTPESRDAVRYVARDDLRWVLQRYRDVHDIWHVLTGVPTTLLGETAQKWFEAAHTGLPVAAMSAVAGPVQLSTQQRRVLVTKLIPWAVSCGRRADNLLAIRYEDHLETDLDQLRKRWRMSVPDVDFQAVKRRPTNT